MLDPALRLSGHPESADTVEGIHQWWIEWPGIAESISITSIALKQLEQTGQIERRSIGNQEIWRLPMRGSDCRVARKTVALLW